MLLIHIICPRLKFHRIATHGTAQWSSVLLLTDWNFLEHTEPSIFVLLARKE